jgi:hypothetical protein
MSKRVWVVALPVLAVALPLAAFEVGMRFVVKPSTRSAGLYRGIELPPVPVVPYRFVRPDPGTPVPGAVVDGHPLTRGDLFGSLREDPEIGYALTPAFRSRYGWWESNELGARSRTPTSKAVPEGRRRVAVFGDSFAAGTRVPQESTWTVQLEAKRPGLEVVNFGVDGYGMGQALLLDRRMRDRIDYGVALYVFVPWHDPWRDVNVVRYLGEGWNSFTPMPRFVLDGAGIRLVPPLYPNGTAVYEKDFPAISPGMRDHLRAYDRFYVRSLHEPPPVISHLMLWKLVAGNRGANRRAEIREEIGRDVGGEAFEVCRRILKSADDEARARGAKVLVAVLPVQADLEQLAKDPGARDRWQHIVRSIHVRGIDTVDLAPSLLAAPAADIDFGADGTHYGPKVGAVVAQTLAPYL